MVIYNIHSQNPQKRYLESTVAMLKKEDGIAVYPTDTVYGMGAAISNPKAIDKIGHILQKDRSRLFSFICSDIGQISAYVRLSNTNFRLIKRYLPGAYTFILPATNLVPKKICPKRRTVGVRIPNNRVLLDLVDMLGEPLANTSINLPGDLRGNPEEVRKAVLHDVDVMLDAGILENPSGSTIIDLTNDDPVVIREGKGDWAD